jgi:peptide/nickel transport system substrate-binding protein
MMKTLRLSLIASLIAFASISAPAAGPKTTLNVGMSAEFESLHPSIASQGATSYMLNLAYRSMIILSIDGKWKPMLIKEIPTLENKMAKRVGEGLEINFEIRPEYQWGDGTPLTCKDVHFAWEVGKHPNVSTPSKEPYENVSSITWDEKTPKKCKVVFIKAKFNYFTLIFDPLPDHLERPVFEKFKDKPEGYDHNTLYSKDPTNVGLWNGPFTVSEVKLGSHVSFKANPKFGGKKPFFENVVFKVIPNSNTMTARLQAGDIDMISPPAGLDLSQATAFEKKVKEEKLPYKVMFQEGVIYSHIDINMENPAFKDLAVRQAISHVINKKEVIMSFVDGKATPAESFITPSNPWYTKKLTTYEYNRRKATELLDKAGWKPGANGIRAKDGVALSFTIFGSAGSKLVENVEAYLQAQLKGIGMELKIKNEPPRVFFGETTKKRAFDLAIYSWVSIPESSPRSMLHSEMIPTEKNSWAGQNNPGWKNAEVDKLIDQLEAEFDAKKRAQFGQKIAEIYAKEIPVIPLYYRMTNTVIPADMQGYELSGHLYYETLYIENWSRK